MEHSVAKPKRPLGIIVLAILMGIFGVLVILVGFVASALYTGFSSDFGLTREEELAAFAIGVIPVAMGVLLLVSAAGAFALKKWGWVLNIMSWAIIAFWGVYSLLTAGFSAGAVIFLLAALGALTYLLRPEVKRAFGLL